MKRFSGFSQLLILFVIALISTIGASVYYFSKTRTVNISEHIESSSSIALPEASVEIASPSASASASITPKAKVTTTTTTSTRPGFHLDSTNLRFGSEKRLLTLNGNGFGLGFNRIIFDDDASKYSDYGLYGWNNTKIEVTLPKEVPDNSDVKVAVIKPDGTKSNSLSFNTKTWDKSSNTSIDCKTPTNFRGNAISSTEAKLEWDTDSNVKGFTILQAFYNDKGEVSWLYPREVRTYENLPNGSMNIPGLGPNSYNYFSLTVGCSNGYPSFPTPTLTIKTP